MNSFDTVIVSDLHLGARNSRCDDFLKFLRSTNARRLIFNGDLFQNQKLDRLNDREVAVLDALRQKSTEWRVDWLLGNHDPSAERLAAILGIEARSELVLDVAGRRYLVCHGHVWDKSLNWPRWLIGGAEGVYYACQRLDPSQRVARYLKHRSKKFCRAGKNLMRHAIREAKERRLAGVILGHTHAAVDSIVDGVHYLNSGCWTEQPNGFVGVCDGTAHAYSWSDGEAWPIGRPRVNSVPKPHLLTKSATVTR